MRRWICCLLILGLTVFPVHAAPTGPCVALTFDDGPSGKYTRTLLDGLALRGAKATFLLCGYRMVQYPDIAQRIFDEGHEIGYHGYSHKTMQTMSRKTIGQELIDSQKLLPKDCDPVFLRPPGGIVTDGGKAHRAKSKRGELEVLKLLINHYHTVISYAFVF